MTTTHAKRILELYRAGDPSVNEREMQTALEFTRNETEVKTWFEQHLAVERAVTDKFREIPVPASLKERLLAQPKIVRLQFAWSAKQWMQLAAAVAILICGIATLLIYTAQSGEPRFAQFETRMVRSALREYKMEVFTKDMGQLRHWMEKRNAPADFQVPKGLSKLALTGGGVLHWHNHPVSMACFDRGDKKMLFLFVMDKSALNDPPSTEPQLDDVKKLAVASWSAGDKAYLLAAPGDKDNIRKYL
jgi:hypothetical protein